MKFLRLAVGAAIAATLLYLTVRHIQWHGAVAILANVDAWYFCAAIAALTATYCVRILRWTIMLRTFDESIRWRTAAGPFMASFALNNLMPFRFGDIVRCFGFRRAIAVTPPRVLGTVLVERILDFVALLTIFGAVLGVARPQSVQATYLTHSAIIVAVILIPCMAAILYPPVAGALIVRLRRLPFLMHIRIVHKTALFALRAIRSLKIVGMGGRTPILLGLSFTAWLLEGLCFFMVVCGLHGHTGWLGSLFSMASGTLATLIPSTPGYVGTFDLFTKMGLTAFGEPATRAAVEALTIHAMLWLPITAVGLVYIGYIWGVGPALQFLGRQSSRAKAIRG